MSKKTQDLSKLRKKLEQSSKKTRRSTDLRRSLGRKSVGDNSFSDIATLEQASFSGSTFNESCHLNPDSAIIDPAVTENPDWFKNLPPDLQASERSILEALQKERDEQLSNNSNISLVNASFDKRKIPGVLNCSVVVSRESIDRQIKRPSLNVDDSASGSPLIENLSKELPQRRPNTLGKGLRKRSKNSLDAQFRKALEESGHSDESLEVPRKISKTSAKEVSDQNIITTHSKKSSTIENSPGEVPQRRPTTLGKGLRKRSKNSLDAEFRKALEESGHSDESSEVPRKTLAKEGSDQNNITERSKNSDLVPSPIQDSPEEVPQRRPTSLGKGHRTRTKSSLDAEFRAALEDSGHSEENLEALRKLSKSSSKDVSRKHKLSTLGQTQNQGPPLSEDIFDDLPQRRPNTLGKGLRKRSKNSLDAEFRKVFEDSGHSDESLEVSRKSRAIDVSETNKITALSKNSDVEPSPIQDSPEGVPQRRPSSLRKGHRTRSKSSLDAEFREALEDSGHSEENLEALRKLSKSSSKDTSQKHKLSTLGQTQNQGPPLTEDILEDLPQRRPNTLGKGLRKRSKNSLDAEFRKALEESGNSDESLEASRKTHAKEGSDQNNITTRSKNSDTEPSPIQELPEEVPQRRPTSLGKGQRTRTKSSLDAEFREALEDSGHSEENLEALRRLSKSSSKETSQKHKLSTLSETPNLGSPTSENLSGEYLRRKPHTQLLKPTSRTLATANKDKSMDESLDLPRRKQTTIGKYQKRDFDDNSALDKFKRVLEDTSSSSEDEREGSKSYNVGNTATPSQNPVHDKENVPHIKITSLLERSESDSFNLPVGAEASNLSGLPGNIEPKRRSLFLGRKRVSKESAVSVVAEDTEPEPSQEKETDLRGNLEPMSSKLGSMNNIPQSCEDSVTDNTRHLPLSIANIEVIQSDDLPVNLSAKSRNSSQFPVQSARSFSMLNFSSPQVQSRKSQRVSVLSEIVPVNLSISRESGIPSPRSTAVLSEHPSQAMNATPLSTQKSEAPRRISKSFQEKLIDKNLESGNSVRNTGVYDESSDSSASTISLPSNVTGFGTDSVFTRNSSNVVKISRPETLTSSMQTIDTLGSDSVFIATSKNKLLKSGSLQTESVPSSNSIPPTNVPEVLQDGNDTWTENPYPDRTMDSFGVGDLEPLGKDSSPISESDDESDEGYANEGESSDKSENPRMAIKHSHMSDASAKSLSNSPLHSFPSPAANLKVSEGHKSIRSSLNQSNIGLENVVAAVMPNFEKTQNIGKKIKAPLKAPPKKLTEPELDKMRSGLKKWMDDIKKDVHSTVEESRLVSTLKTTSFKKPEKPAPKAAKGAAKKKDPDPYFGDYRPPKRVKPRPYVTDKMYKFLEKKLKDKFGLEARIKAEDFVAVLCNLVQNTIKEKNKNKYLKMVFKLRSEMVKRGLIRTQFDYHLFIEDYLPDAFRVKSIPCYGCSKGPTLDVEDLHKDLSVK